MDVTSLQLSSSVLKPLRYDLLYSSLSIRGGGNLIFLLIIPNPNLLLLMIRLLAISISIRTDIESPSFLLLGN